MIKTNFYNGEMSTNEQYISEAEAMQNAGFGQYAVQQQQQAYIPPTTYGLGGNVYQQQYPQQQTYPNPYMNQYQQNQYQQPFSYGNRINTGVYGNGYNPGYLQFYDKPKEEPGMVYIPPLNPSGNQYMLPANFNEIAGELIMRYTKEEAEFQGKQIAAEAARKRQGQTNYSYNNNYGFGYNYYDSSLFAPSYQQNFRSSIMDDLEEIKASAREARYRFDTHMSKLVHHYLNDGVTDEQIEELYKGRYVPVEKNVYTNCAAQDKMQERLRNMVEIDPTEPYRLAQVAAQREIQSILPPDTTIEEFGSRAALLYSKWELEELYERRRSFRNDYDPSTYRRILREKIAEKECNKRGFSLMTTRSEIPHEITKIIDGFEKVKQLKSGNLSAEDKTHIMKSALNDLNMPLLSNCISFDEKGNMVLSANIGNAKGNEYKITDEYEAHYANKRAQFAGFLDSIPRSEELHDQKIDAYNDYANYQSNELFKWDLTHPKPTIEHNDGGG